MNETVTPNRRLDLLGFFCPIPVHETRKALGEMQEGDFLEAVSYTHLTLPTN